MPKHTHTQCESWKSIPHYEGVYEISDHGRVRSLDRVDALGHSRKGKMRKLATDNKGYDKVALTKNSETTNFFVHRLVLMTFVGPCPPGMEGCHEDGDQSNNHVSNLRWGTHASNMQDRVKHGTDVQSNRTHCPRGHELVSGNLMLSNLRAGKRSCLACDRARGHLKTRPHLRDNYQQISDSYYASILDQLSFGRP